jgi:ketosteroid isomerase-like protein
MAHPNEELVRRGYNAFARGDMDTSASCSTQGIVWHFPGRSPLAGDHRGVDAVLGFFGRTMELTAGTFRAELHDVVADDRHTVGMHLARASARAEAGGPGGPGLPHKRRQGRRGLAVHRGPVHLRRVLLLAAADHRPGQITREIGRWSLIGVVGAGPIRCGG